MLTVEFDFAQARLTSDMLSMLASGPDWLAAPVGELAFDSPSVWIEPVKQTVMLMPAPVHPAWIKRTDGIYTKYNLSDFTDLTDAAHWRAVHTDEGGAFMQYFASSGNPGSLSGKTPTQPENQPMVVEWHQPHLTFDTAIVMECGWSDTGSGGAGVSLRVMAGGRVEVWKDGLMQGTYSLSASQLGPDNGSASAPARGFISLMLIPFRDRELLVHSSAGGAFTHLFPDLNEGEAGQTITSASAFWFNLPAPRAQAIRIAPIQFATSDTVYSRTTAWRFPPPAGEPDIRIYQSLSQESEDLITASVVDAAWNPAGLSLPKQIRVELVGGPSQTPFLYGVRASYPPETASTATVEGGGLDGGEDLIGASLSVDDSVGGAVARLLLQPSETIANLRMRMGRPVRLGDEAGALLQGVAEAPTWTDAFSEASEDVDLVVRDGWKLAEEYVFADPIPLDGLSLAEAYSLVTRAFGAESDISDAADSVLIGASGVSGRGMWECLIEVGDRASVWLTRLHHTYAASWAHLVDRDGKFVLRAPEDMPSDPALTLYRSIEDAITGGEEADSAWQRVYRSSHRTLLEPEANEVWVMGQDLRSGRPILVARRDVESADPTLAEEARPDNWLGRIRKVAYGDPALTSKEACLQALDLLYKRMTSVRSLMDIECEYLAGLWKGDLVTLKGAGDGGEDVVGRIKAFQGRFCRSDADASYQPFHYVLEVGDLVAPLGDHGFSAPSIGANRRARLQRDGERFSGPLGRALKGAPQDASLTI